MLFLLQLKARDVAGQALLLVKDLVAALLNFHSYTEQRLHIYPLDSSIQPISPLNQRVSKIPSPDSRAQTPEPRLPSPDPL